MENRNNVTRSNQLKFTRERPETASKPDNLFPTPTTKWRRSTRNCHARYATRRRSNHTPQSQGTRALPSNDQHWKFYWCYLLRHIQRTSFTKTHSKTKIYAANYLQRSKRTRRTARWNHRTINDHKGRRISRISNTIPWAPFGRLQALFTNDFCELDLCIWKSKRRRDSHPDLEWLIIDPTITAIIMIHNDETRSHM